MGVEGAVDLGMAHVADIADRADRVLEPMSVDASYSEEEGVDGVQLRGLTGWQMMDGVGNCCESLKSKTGYLFVLAGPIWEGGNGSKEVGGKSPNGLCCWSEYIVMSEPPATQKKLTPDSIQLIVAASARRAMQINSAKRSNSSSFCNYYIAVVREFVEEQGLVVSTVMFRAEEIAWLQHQHRTQRYRSYR